MVPLIRNKRIKLRRLSENENNISYGGILLIKAYLGWIASLYEGESIEVKYTIHEEQELLLKEAIMMDYKKPAIVGQVALSTLLKKLKRHRNKEIVILINDSALYEIVRGTSTTGNKDVLKMASQMRKELAEFPAIVIKDASKDRMELTEWNEQILRKQSI